MQSSSPLSHKSIQTETSIKLEEKTTQPKNKIDFLISKFLAFIKVPRSAEISKPHVIQYKNVGNVETTQTTHQVAAKLYNTVPEKEKAEEKPKVLYGNTQELPQKKPLKETQEQNKPSPSKTDILSSMAKVQRVEISMKNANKIGSGFSKEAYAMPISKKEFKHLKSQLKAEKEMETASTSRKEEMPKEKLIQSILNKISSVIFKKAYDPPLQLSYDKISANHESSKEETRFLNNMEKIKARVSPSVDQQMKKDFPLLYKFICIASPITMKSFNESLSTPKERAQFFKETHQFFEEKQLKRVASLSDDKNISQEELSQAHLVQSSLKQVSSSFKKYLAVPLFCKIKGEDKEGLLDRLYTLGSTDNLIKGKKLTQESKYDISIQAAKGLSALHAGKLIHCDFAARNIFVGDKVNSEGDYALKVGVSDWGNVHQEGSSWDRSKHAAFHWSSPELIRGQTMTNKSDSWSYGVFLLEMMQPKDLKIQGDLIQMIFNDSMAHGNALIKLASPSLYMKETIEKFAQEKGLKLHPEMEKLILSCFNDDPEKRPTMIHMANELEKLKADGVPFEFIPVKKS